jgi:hypothetical protein
MMKKEEKNMHERKVLFIHLPHHTYLFVVSVTYIKKLMARCILKTDAETA